MRLLREQAMGTFDVKTTGMVFDIRRFSTHDGDGIRTTIFLKGCSLACVWCQNPEGIRTLRRPLHFKNKCIQCEICCNMARQGGMKHINGQIKIDAGATEDWDVLIDACPAGALAWDSQQMSVAEVVDEVMKDEVFFKHGGGVTISGGEPLMQPAFVLSLLKAFKQKGIHTAIETALHIPREVLQPVLPYLDLIYADMKLFDREQHLQYIGKPNERIKENIAYLLNSAKKDAVIIRTPMIPGITTSEENIAKISRFISDIYPDVSYEILNYNPLAEAKYHLVDMTYCFIENPKLYSSEAMAEFIKIAQNHGVHNIMTEL